jgi:hypothetical protein
MHSIPFSALNLPVYGASSTSAMGEKASNIPLFSELTLVSTPVNLIPTHSPHVLPNG